MHYDRISADSHIDMPWLPPELFTSNTTARLKERMPHVVDGPEMKPSDYWRRQCKATFQFDRIGAKLIDELGVETLMWGSDYPHTDGVWPESSKYITEQFSHVSAERVRKITCENAGIFYGLMN